MTAGTLDIQAWKDGAAFRIKVHARARRERLAGVHGAALRVEVTAPPERGKANRAVLRLLADGLDLSGASLCLLAGETSSEKRIGVRGMSAAALRQRLALATGGEA